jgi:hypothetical protein
MTNAEKYLKDEVNILELWENFSDYYYKNKDKESDVAKAFKLFFWEQAKPTLTEDERVILQALKIMGIERISRDKETDICLHYSSANRYGELGEKFAILNLYFQFIKERRRIRDRRAFERRIKMYFLIAIIDFLFAILAFSCRKYMATLLFFIFGLISIYFGL